MKIEDAMQWCRGERNFRTKESTQHQVMNICLDDAENKKFFDQEVKEAEQ